MLARNRLARDGAPMRFVLMAFVAVALLAWGGAVPAGSPSTARAGLGIARVAADAWADDARLVWVENDSDLDRSGQARTWGYLFYAPSRGAMRSWSVRDGRIVDAEDHAVRVDAPGVEDAWVDSPAAVRSVWRQLDAATAPSAVLESLVLARDVFGDGNTWLAVFRIGSGPRLHLVVDAGDGRLVRRWRG